MKVFVTGVCGQLGHDCVNEIIGRGGDAVGSDIQPAYSGIADGSAVTTAPYVQLDITNREAVGEIIAELKPDAIIHCAAWTNVDGAENPEKKEIVHRINAVGTQNIADAAKAIDAKMLYLSTDYVFDGQGERPWEPDDKCYAPLNVYGQSKLDGEKAVSSTLNKFFIVRIAWVFGLNCFLQVLFGKSCKQKWRKLNLQNGESCRHSQLTVTKGCGNWIPSRPALRLSRGLRVVSSPVPDFGIPRSS